MRGRWRLGASLTVALVLGAVALGGCGDKRVATVNGVHITENEFINQLKHGEVARQVLLWMIHYQLVVDELKRLNLQVMEAEINRGIQNYRQQYGLLDERAFVQHLQQQGYTRESLRKDIRFTLALDKLLTKDVKVSDKDVADYFKQNREQFDQPDLVRLSRIFTHTKEQADAAIRRLGEGSQWNEVVKTYSEDSPEIKNTGGQLPNPFPLASMPPDIRATVTSTGVGEHTKPLPFNDGQGHSGYMILRIRQKIPKKAANLDERLKTAIRERLTLERALQGKLAPGIPLEQVHQQAHQELLAKLRAKARVTIRDPDFMQLNDVFKPRPAAAGDLPLGGSPLPPPPASPPPAAGGGK